MTTAKKVRKQEGWKWDQSLFCISSQQSLHICRVASDYSVVMYVYIYRTKIDPMDFSNSSPAYQPNHYQRVKVLLLLSYTWRSKEEESTVVNLNPRVDTVVYHHYLELAS